MRFTDSPHHRFTACLLVLWLGWAAPLCRAAELLMDTAFADGFGAAYIYGRRGGDGALSCYRDISPLRVHLIPEGPVDRVGLKTHPWDFQEGYHENYTNKRGEQVFELHAHRLVVNHVVEADTPRQLQFAQFNNDGLAPGDPGWNTRLVKRVTSDRRGTLRLFYNSQNELRNAATDHSSAWARDTWPHFLVNQRFDNPIALADFRRMDFTVTYQVERMRQLSPWPNMLGSAARSSMGLNFMFQVRHRDDPQQRLFVGMMLFTGNEKLYAPHVGVEQHGLVFVRDSVARDQPAPVAGEQRVVRREFKAMLGEALRLARQHQPAISDGVDDYLLGNFSIGFEGMGHWESECTISGLSLTGVPRSIAAISRSTAPAR
jgi:hypothetical protein